ncbi:biotin--[acetyl-CoA-carboxylase] ligase [Sphingomonas sabuli]|uniref:biotin--[acetyl-CoA-carboxylase] ligase n=1 Tax=Sphingomonas sabuli TaxID=2764186 RepID=UPI0031B650DC
MADRGAVEGDWLVTLDQTAGRGRQGRSWITRPGNFFGSTLVVLRAGDPPPQSLSLAAGLALIEAAETAVGGQPLQLKWPNDLLLGGAKLAGILLERHGDRVVIGFGVNLADAPAVEGRALAHLDGRIAPQAFAPLLAGAMSRMLGLWRSSEPDLFAQAWLARAHSVGTQIAVHSGDAERVSGRFDGIDADGTLRLRLPDGTVRKVHAGDVEL